MPRSSTLNSVLSNRDVQTGNYLKGIVVDKFGIPKEEELNQQNV